MKRTHSCIIFGFFFFYFIVRGQTIYTRKERAISNTTLISFSLRDFIFAKWTDLHTVGHTYRQSNASVHKRPRTCFFLYLNLVDFSSTTFMHLHSQVARGKELKSWPRVIGTCKFLWKTILEISNHGFHKEFHRKTLSVMLSINKAQRFCW